MALATSDMIRAFPPQEGKDLVVSCSGHLDARTLGAYSLAVTQANPYPIHMEPEHVTRRIVLPSDDGR